MVSNLCFLGYSKAPPTLSFIFVFFLIILSVLLLGFTPCNGEMAESSDEEAFKQLPRKK